MTDIVERAFEALRNMQPASRRDDIARYIIFLASETPMELTPEDEVALAEAEEQIARSEFVSEKEMEAFWKSCGLPPRRHPREGGNTR